MTKKHFIRFAILILPIFSFTLSLNAQTINTFAGNGTAASTGNGGYATAASFNNPGGVYYDAHGNFYVVEYTGQKIRKIDPTGIVSAFAGTGVAGYSGDGGPATAATFYDPIDLISDNSGNIYIVDNVNQRIRKIDTFGIITTFAGNGIRSYSGDGGPATAASLNDPSRLTIDPAGNIYFADAENNVIRKVDTSGIITTVAGNNVSGFSGDGGPATAASLSQPLGVAIDGNGNMFIADHFNYRIRKVNTSGIISTYAGNGTPGNTGDGGPATAASMEYPNGVAVDFSCNVYFTDWTGETVRKIRTSGTISTVAGNGTAGFSGDTGPAIAAELDGPNNLIFDPSMNLYIPEYYNNRVRKISNLGESTGCPVYIPTASFSSATTSGCQDSCIAFNSTSASSGIIDSVRWTAVPSGAVISNPTSNTTNICFTNSGSFSVKIKAYGGGGVDSFSSTIIINPAPHPHITQSGHTLTASGGPYTSYQWYNGAAISGATNVTYTYTVSGVNYWVVVDSGGCKGQSNNINPLGVITENAMANYFWSNNNNSTIDLYSAKPLDETINITLFDLTGRSILHDSWNQGTNSKEISNAFIPSGLYIIKLSNQTTSVVLKWQKQ